MFVPSTLITGSLSITAVMVALEGSGMEASVDQGPGSDGVNVTFADELLGFCIEQCVNVCLELTEPVWHETFEWKKVITDVRQLDWKSQDRLNKGCSLSRLRDKNIFF